MAIFPPLDPKHAKRFREAGHWRSETIWQLFEQAAANHPDKPAIRQAHRSIDYGALYQQAELVAARLEQCGIVAGDIVTICGPNWIETVVAIVASWRLGAVANPIAVTSGARDLRFVLEKCRSKVAFVSGKFRSSDHLAALQSFRSDLDPAPTIFPLSNDGPDLVKPLMVPTRAAPADPDAPAVVLFTSGTESRSKGVVHTHNTILFGERALAEALDLTSADIAFMASPISHATGFLHGVVMTLTLGGTLSLMDVFDAASAADQIAEHGATWTMGATPFLSEVADAVASRGERLVTLRYFLSGGAPVPEAIGRKAADAGIRVLSIYGSTESPPHTLVRPDDPPEKSFTTDGRALSGIEIKIVDQQGVGVGVGEVGEACSRGPNLFIGYLDEPELSARAIDQDGWYHSGDLARALDDGFLRITGRIKDIIIRGGQNISAREVEEHLLDYPGCIDVAVVAIPHNRLGETGCAVMVMSEGYSVVLPDVALFLKSRGLANYKIPERVEIWERLPRTATGKVQKFEIRTRLRELTVDA